MIEIFLELWIGNKNNYRLYIIKIKNIRTRSVKVLIHISQTAFVN